MFHHKNNNNFVSSLKTKSTKPHPKRYQTNVIIIISADLILKSLKNLIGRTKKTNQSLIFFLSLLATVVFAPKTT